MKNRRIFEYDRIVSDANITPLVDTCLVLLLIFMISAHVMVQSSIPVTIPSSKHSESSPTEKGVVITVDKDKRLFFGHENEEISEDFLMRNLKDEIEKTKTNVVYLRADAEVPIQTIVDLADLIKDAKGRVSLITNLKSKSEEKPEN